MSGELVITEILLERSQTIVNSFLGEEGDWHVLVFAPKERAPIQERTEGLAWSYLATTQQQAIGGANIVALSTFLGRILGKSEVSLYYDVVREHLGVLTAQGKARQTVSTRGGVAWLPTSRRSIDDES
jgi:hypothetical protein